MYRERENLNAYYQAKQGNLKRLHTVWFQLYNTLKKAKLWNSKKTSSCQGLGRGWMSKWNIEMNTGSGTTRYNTVTVDTYHDKFVKTPYNVQNQD